MIYTATRWQMYFGKNKYISSPNINPHFLYHGSSIKFYQSISLSFFDVETCNCSLVKQVFSFATETDQYIYSLLTLALSKV